MLWEKSISQENFQHLLVNSTLNFALLGGVILHLRLSAKVPSGVLVSWALYCCCWRQGFPTPQVGMRWILLGLMRSNKSSVPWFPRGSSFGKSASLQLENCQSILIGKAGIFFSELPVTPCFLRIPWFGGEDVLYGPWAMFGGGHEGWAPSFAGGAGGNSSCDIDFVRIAMFRPFFMFFSVVLFHSSTGQERSWFPLVLCWLWLRSSWLVMVPRRSWPFNGREGVQMPPYHWSGWLG